MLLSKLVEEYAPAIVELYTDLHMYPEISLEEHRTTRVIRDQLIKRGIEILEVGLDTGVIGIIRGKYDGPTIALRADIDALPVNECEDHMIKSKNGGVMHACGHDVHTSALMGAIMLLSAQRDSLKGNVVFIFQPAEENIQGAKKVINSGLFTALCIDAIFGLHVRPELQIGYVGLKIGTVMAAKDSFEIVIHGIGGHGSAPQDTADPILAGAAIVLDLQSIVSRNIDPREAAVLSICSVHADGCDNIIPETLKLLGSMRSCSIKARSMMKTRLAEISEGVSASYGCKAEVQFNSGVPVTMNHESLYDIAAKSAVNALGEGCIQEINVDMGSEDFSMYSELIPAFYYFLGVRSAQAEFHPLHSALFQADENAPIMGAELLATSALQAIESLK